MTHAAILATLASSMADILILDNTVKLNISIFDGVKTLYNQRDL